MIEEMLKQGITLEEVLTSKKTRYDQNGQVIFSTPFFDESAESDEHQPTTLNQILENLFNMRRLKRKLFLINRKRQRIQRALKQTIVNIVHPFNKEKVKTTTQHDK